MSGAVLGVERSLGNATWRAAPSLVPSGPLKRRARELAEHYQGLPLAASYVFAWKIAGIEDHEGYLTPTIRDLLPNPSRFKDMDRAAERLADAVKEGTPIGVFGDYDVDGAASAALLVRVLGELGLTVDVHIPDRKKEGYGPNREALAKLKKNGAGLILTVDCGITAHEPLAAVAETGMDVIVVDHHLAGAELPRAHSVINPNRLDEDGSYGYLCAAGVVFIFLVALLRELRRRGHFPEGDKGPNLLGELDIVGLATVCDVVPMKGLNRAFVKQGLKSYIARDNLGLAALGDVVGVNAAPSPYTFGFLLGPRINAAGRIDDSDLGVRLLTTDDESKAAGLAMALNDINTKRRDIESKARAQALDMAAAQEGRQVTMVRSQDWHEGVIGIVAGRVCETTGKPALVLTHAKGGGWKGSGRSIPGFKLGAAVLAARELGIIEGGGGHDMAAGFQVAEDRLAALQDFMCERFVDEYGGEPKRERLVAGLLRAGGIDAGLVNWLEHIGPYGSDNPEPRFAIPDCRVKYAKQIGQEKTHISCSLDDDAGGKVRAILFNASGTQIGNAILKARDGQLVHVLGRVRKSPFGSQDSVQFEIEDAAFAAGGA